MRLIYTATMVALLSCSIFTQAASLDKPLLMEGKTTLYQRVLSTPSCLLHQKADQSDKGVVVPAFSQYYVYEDLADVYHVGANATGKLDGYLSKACVVPWKQQVALLFTNPADRQRSLIFKEEGGLDQVIDAENGAELYRQYLDQVLANKHVDPVISIEPENYVDYQKNFYLLPVINSNETMFPDGSYAYKHEIASITSDAISQSDAQSQASSLFGTLQQSSNNHKSQDNTKSKPVANNGQTQGAFPNVANNGTEPAIVGFKSAVVFVIDSSISMQPYIDRTKEAVKTIYKSIEKNNLADSVHFGIVSFRADVRKVPGLEYTAKMYLRPGEVNSFEEFNKKVAGLKQASVSSARFDEDSYAGINLALQDIDWNRYGGRYIVLITDAGALDGDDSQSSTGLDANALRLEAEHYGAAIYALHLLTPSGVKNHKKAQSQYEALSYNSILNKPLYYSVKAGDVKQFGAIVEALSDSITTQVQQAVMGQLSAGSSLAAKTEQNNVEEKIVEDSKKLGLAMQLAYLGRVEGTKSPEFMQGWLSDRDIVDHNKITCTPIVLVNKNQLSDLYTLVDGVLQSGIAGQLSSDDMFAQLQALAAQMGRDPNQLNSSKTISELGITSELLDDLPYKSRIAQLSPDDWYNLGAQEQETIIRALENSLKYLQHCSSDNDRWFKLNENADDSEAVYPVPLDALP